MAVIKTQFTLRLDVVIHCKIKKITQEENRSLTNMIDHLIKREIKCYEKENGEIAVTEEDYGIKQSKKAGVEVLCKEVPQLY